MAHVSSAMCVSFNTLKLLSGTLLFFLLSVYLMVVIFVPPFALPFTTSLKSFQLFPAIGRLMDSLEWPREIHPSTGSDWISW